MPLDPDHHKKIVFDARLVFQPPYRETSSYATATMVLYLNSVNYIVLKFTLKLCKPDFKVLSIVFSKVP